ncbi:MAG: ATP-binding protein [Rhizobiaceae bacterium]
MSALFYLILVVLAVGYLHRTVYHNNLDQLAEAGQIRVKQAKERLVDQLDRYRVLANLLARDPRTAKAVSIPAMRPHMNEFLRRQSLTYGAVRIELTDAEGRILATSQPLGRLENLNDDALLQAAINGRLGLTHRLENGVRQFKFSRGVLADGPAPIGAIVISADIAGLEFEWSVVPESIGFFDENDVVFVSNRPSLLLRQDRDSLTPGGEYAQFPSHGRETVATHEIWSFEFQSDLPDRALVVAADVPQIDMTVRGFIDIAPARSSAQLQASLAAALLAVLGLIALIAFFWRQRISEKLALEGAMNAQLEIRVEERAAQLRATQHQLVQATKMTALGQMSAGISHELNQPLAAILNFSENGRRYLDLERLTDASANFDQITGQVNRMDRIVKNLRAFARAEREDVETVDLKLIINEAMTLVDTTLKKHLVEVHSNLPAHEVLVLGGHVRLQQVLVNLLTNAVDAMAQTPNPQIWLDLKADETLVTLRVRDNGPGIADPGRVFEPFFSTKELGASKGLGLGLSISYGIVGSFGGDIVAATHAEGGAEFVVTLKPTEEGETR